MTASELAAKSMIDRSLISREIEPLKAKGYITAEKSVGKRSYNAKIRLTEKGKAIAEKIGEMAIEIQKLADMGIDEEELIRFYSTLQKISENLFKVADENEK